MVGGQAGIRAQVSWLNTLHGLCAILGSSPASGGGRVGGPMMKSGRCLGQGPEGIPGTLPVAQAHPTRLS